MEGPSHVAFGVAGAVVIESMLHISSPPLFPLPSNASALASTLTSTVTYFGCAALGSIAPDIDNAQSTIGKRFGILSKGIQHFAGHRTFFHSLLGLAFIGALLWFIQYGIGWFLSTRLHLTTGNQLPSGIGSSITIHKDIGIALAAFLIGYFLHLVADSLTIGGVPWLFPNRTRYGFPPNRNQRFKSGSLREPIVVVVISVLVILGIVSGIFTI